MAKILVVEDEKVLNDAYKLVLSKEGHKVDTAFDGEEALDKFNKTVPDLMLLDLRMPKMGGVELLRQLELEKKYPKVKVIVFSNYSDQKEIDEAYSLGAKHYILKAWSSPGELIKVVRTTLKR